MTRKWVKEIINGIIKDYADYEVHGMEPRVEVNSELVSALAEAKKSIEAWDKVLSDLEKANENYSEKYGFSGGISAAKDIINKHLNGIAE